ncbi:MAG: TetR/AcrR family transcriptional regulator [Bacteroidales bacterium]
MGKRQTDGEQRPGERIIAAARQLFCRDGIHATGIDRILAAAGTAKMTLYNQFGSKEALVEAVLRRESEEWRSWLRAALRAAGDTPRAQLENLFVVLRQWFESEDYSGCALMNAVAEYPKGDPRIRALALEHKAGVGAILTELIAEAGCARPAELLNEMAILLDGAIIAALIAGDPAAADAAGRIARTVIASHLED